MPYRKLFQEMWSLYGNVDQWRERTLSKLREYDITQKRLSAVSGIQQPNICAILGPRQRVPSIETMLILDEALLTIIEGIEAGRYQAAGQ
jgi:hypothetical protein